MRPVSARPAPAKVMVAGGPGSGKTSFVCAASEIRPVVSDAPVSAGQREGTRAGAGAVTTAAMDFGRLTLGGRLALHLFGLPGMPRFGYLWPGLSLGCSAAVVLADTRRLDACFPSLEFFEAAGVGLVLAVNQFDGAPCHPPEAVRAAAQLAPDLPVVACDARDRDSAARVLACLGDHLLRAAGAPAAGPAPAP